MPTPNKSVVKPVPPMLEPLIHSFTAGATAWNRATHISAEAKPATKLLTFGCIDGRYRKPEPDECWGMTNMS
jgi:hypothetical protein